MSWLRRKLGHREDRDANAQAVSQESVPAAQRDEPQGGPAICDNCGAPTSFEGDDSGSVTVSFGQTAGVTTLCASCTRIAEKEQQWRTTGVWVGSDPPPSIANARELTPEEVRELFGQAQPDDPDALK